MKSEPLSSVEPEFESESTEVIAGVSVSYYREELEQRAM